MPLQHSFEEIIESSTDPALDASYTIDNESLWLDTSTNPAILKERNASNTGWNTVGSSTTPAAPIGLKVDEFTATLNQTTFTLSGYPIDQNTISVVLNQTPQTKANITGLSGNQVTVITGLTAGDIVWFKYSEASRFFTDEFTVGSDNQTNFTLTYTPVPNTSFEMSLNQIIQSPTNVTSNSGTLLVVSTGLMTGDKLWVTYPRLS